MQYMTQGEIDAFTPDSLPTGGLAPLELAERAMRSAGCWSGNQQMGGRWPVGCVALEITQRCNLDCTLCYLSEHSEAVKDIPLEEVFRRIDLIHEHYGWNTDVQITGGDPTLRQRDELIAIVGRVRQRGMRPTLMTNGRKATRALLETLATEGLVDVAFHVDTHDGNFGEIPDVVRFFKANAGRIRTAAFHVQAATGRGVHEKKTEITLDAVTAQIERGAGTAINFRSSLAGHSRCNRYGLCFEV
ncbi:MAG: radical SAM protein, partial [Betaproteobacteria bacterium]|nr:radical SAM protein [Betaproteobacteria bacterium]